MSNGEGVSYTVKELLAMLEKTLTEQIGHIGVRIEEVNRKLDQKASEARVEHIEKRLYDLEISAAKSRAVSVSNKWLVTGVALPIFGAVATLIWLAAGGH